MATFTNFATLSYNGGSTVSNTVTGEIIETLTMQKTALTGVYTSDGDITYVLSLVNTGATAYTDLTITDDLGGYLFDATTVYPLNYVDGSIRYFVNGVLQAAPTVTAGPPLVISGIDVPAGGNAVIVYEATTTAYAPLATASTITNTATATGGGLSNPVVAQETVTIGDGIDLSITKSLSPTIVSENGQITYTFLIANSGNTPAVATDNIVLSDTFDPILSGITVTLNGTPLVAGTDYTYDPATGLFTTTAGLITVPAATFTQNPDGTYSTTPGTSVLTVTGTV